MDLKKILGNIGCNLLGTVIPPFGSMAESFIREALNLDADASAESVAEAVESASPDQVLALKEAEYKFKVKLKKMNVDILKLEKQDIEDAREFAKETGTGSINGLAIFNALFVVVVTAGALILMYSGKIVNMNALEASILTLLIREAFGRYEQVCNFFFGSSHGSKQKTDIMGKK
jgi:hypothetical protein